MKTCAKCKIKKSKEEFCKDKKNKDGLYNYCKVCKSERLKEWGKTPRGKELRKKSAKKYSKTPGGKEVHRKIHLKYNYGITIEEYDKILESQGGVCKICGSDDPGGPHRFHVDHNHITGEIRGLLCTNCNRGLGGFKDSVDILVSAIKYLS